jgi:anti-anti-sigma factor
MAQIQVRQREGVVLLDISGTLSGTAEALHADVGKALASGSRGVVLNLQEATYVDSTWLGAIVQTFAKLSGRRTTDASQPSPEADGFVRSDQTFDDFRHLHFGR